MKRAIVVLLSAGCGAGAVHAPPPAAFECHDREAEIGYWPQSLTTDGWDTTLTCKGAGPSVLGARRSGGARTEGKRPLTPAQFDQLWSELEASPWRKAPAGCNDPEASSHYLPDWPVFQIDLADGADRRQFHCSTKALPPSLGPVLAAIKHAEAHLVWAADDPLAKIGVAECDVLIDDWRRCLSSSAGADPVEKERVATTITQMSHAWHDLAENHPEEIGKLVKTCIAELSRTDQHGCQIQQPEVTPDAKVCDEAACTANPDMCCCKAAKP